MHLYNIFKFNFQIILYNDFFPNKAIVTRETYILLHLFILEQSSNFQIMK